MLNLLLNTAVNRYNQVIMSKDIYTKANKRSNHLLQKYSIESFPFEFTREIWYNSSDKKRENSLLFSVDTFFYGLKQISSDFKDRINTPSFWRNHWKFDRSPFKVAQAILSQKNIYLVDTTKSDMDCKSPEMSIMLDAPSKISCLWHYNNVFDYSIPTFSFVNDILVAKSLPVFHIWRKTKIEDNLKLLNDWNIVFKEHISDSYIRDPYKIMDY